MDQSEIMTLCKSYNVHFAFPVPPPPENVVLVRFNPTSIGVSWTKFTLVELKGLANYIVMYTIIINSRKRQSELGGTVTVPWTQNQVIISGLQPGAEYDVTVRTSTAAGISGRAVRHYEECRASLAMWVSLFYRHMYQLLVLARWCIMHALIYLLLFLQFLWVLEMEYLLLPHHHKLQQVQLAQALTT